MVEVTRLESGFVHYKEDGSVLHGAKVPADTGVMQVNCTTWCKEAHGMGLDLNNIVDNVHMARHIYDTQGITAWVAYNLYIAKK